jgi:hypothetical protein
MNVAKILSVVFEGDTGDKGDTSSKALESNNNSCRSPVPQVSPNEISWGINSEPKWNSENHTDQRLTRGCPPVPHVPRNLVDKDTYEERAGIIHEAHTTTIADDGSQLPEPIFTITHQQAERMALAETETETET